MPAAIIFCQKSRGYAKIGIGSQYGLAKISFNFLGYCFMLHLYERKYSHDDKASVQDDDCVDSVALLIRDGCG